jgi:hypothetical protein
MGLATQAQPAQGTQERPVRFAGLRAAISTMFEFLAIVVIPALFFASITIAFQVLIPGASDFALGPVPVGKIMSALASGVMTVSIEAAMVGCSALAGQAKKMENEGLRQKYRWFGWGFFVLFLATIGFHIFNVDPSYAQYLELVRCAAAGLYAFLCHGDNFDPDQPTPSTQNTLEMLENKIQSQEARLQEERRLREQEQREREALITQKVEALLQKKLPEMKVQIQNTLMVSQAQMQPPQIVSVVEEKQAVPQLPSGLHASHSLDEVWHPDYQYQLLPTGRVLVTKPDGARFEMDADGTRKDALHETALAIKGWLQQQLLTKNTPAQETRITPPIPEGNEKENSTLIPPSNRPEIEKELEQPIPPSNKGSISGTNSPSNTTGIEPGIDRTITAPITPRNSSRKEPDLSLDWEEVIAKFPAVIEWRSSGLKSVTIDQIIKVTGYTKQKIGRAKLPAVRGGNKRINEVLIWLQKEPGIAGGNSQGKQEEITGGELPTEIQPQLEAQLATQLETELQQELEGELESEMDVVEVTTNPNITQKLTPEMVPEEEEIIQEIDDRLTDTGEHEALSEEVLEQGMNALKDLDLREYQPVPKALDLVELTA